MESFQSENFAVPGKNPSDEVLQRWRNLTGVVRNSKRRFRYTANLSNRQELEELRRAKKSCKWLSLFLKQHCSLYMVKRKRFNHDKYRPPEEVSQAGFEFDADMLSPIVTDRNHQYLEKFFGGSCFLICAC